MVIYLTVPPKRDDWPALFRAGIGVMLTPRSGIRSELAAEAPCWAADNGCYALGERFDLAGYLAWLAAMAPLADRCLFAPAPDVVGDAEATLARSLPVLPEIRRLGFKAALVAQDGLERLPVPWDAFDCLFVGGTDPWKFSERAYGLVAATIARGKWTHQGRVNGFPRLAAAAVAGIGSADGTSLAFNPRRYVPEIAGWVDRLNRQPPLPMGAGDG